MIGGLIACRKYIVCEELSGILGDTLDEETQKIKIYLLSKMLIENKTDLQQIPVDELMEEIDLMNDYNIREPYIYEKHLIYHITIPDELYCSFSPVIIELLDNIICTLPFEILHKREYNLFKCIQYHNDFYDTAKFMKMSDEELKQYLFDLFQHGMLSINN